MANYNSLYTQNLMSKHGVAWLKFDESDATKVVDSKGAFSPTVTGTTVVTGIVGNARSFNGSSDYIMMSNYVIPKGKASVRFRIKKSTVPSTLDYILGESTGTADYGLYFSIASNGGLTVRSGRGTSGTWNFDIASSKNICDNQWHDILFTWDGTTNTSGVKLYIDDMKTPNITGTALSTVTANSSYHMQIGRRPSLNDYYFNGQLDEVEIYNEVINPLANKILLLSSDGVVESVKIRKISEGTIVPEMTSNTAPNGRAFASSIYSGTYDAWKGFNSTSGVGGYEGSWQSSNSTVPQWLAYEFSKSVIIAKYAIQGVDVSTTGVDRNPKDWTLQGSNDGFVNDINILDTQTGQVGWTKNEKREFLIENNNSYKYYRLHITSNNGGVYVAVNVLHLYEVVEQEQINQLPSHSEKIFIKYGLDSLDGFNSIFTNKNYILTDVEATPLEEGKLFEHTIDMTTRKVKKMTL